MSEIPGNFTVSFPGFFFEVGLESSSTAVFFVSTIFELSGGFMICLFIFI